MIQKLNKKENEKLNTGGGEEFTEDIEYHERNELLDYSSRRGRGFPDQWDQGGLQQDHRRKLT